jgi:tRNA-dihydrouridine synthase 1
MERKMEAMLVPTEQRAKKKKKKSKKSKNNSPQQKQKLTGRAWWASLGSPRCVLAPMVGQSELAFRMLCRAHGTTLCYTPMFSSDLFCESEQYRQGMFQTCAADRPLVVQFAGNDASVLLRAARFVERHCDAVDLNLGCPQEVAKRGGYGAFLTDWKQVATIVRTLAERLSVPVTCKIRKLETMERTVAYARMLEQAGCSLLAVHGRQRHEKEETGADWMVVRKLREALDIPVLANGDLWHAEDVQLCQSVCAPHGFMSAQGLLHDPALFEDVKLPTADREGAHLQPVDAPTAEKMVRNCARYMRRRRKVGPFVRFSLSFSFNPMTAHSIRPQSSGGGKVSVSNDNASSSFFSSPQTVLKRFDLAAEYVALTQVYPPSHGSIVRRHLFFILFDFFQANLDLYDVLMAAGSQTALSGLVAQLRARAGANKPSLVKPDASVKRTRRRDGSFAPPPWPVGGGNVGVVAMTRKLHAQKKQASSSSSSSLSSSAPSTPSPSSPAPACSSASSSSTSSSSSRVAVKNKRGWKVVKKGSTQAPSAKKHKKKNSRGWNIPG